MGRCMKIKLMPIADQGMIKLCPFTTLTKKSVFKKRCFKLTKFVISEFVKNSIHAWRKIAERIRGGFLKDNFVRVQSRGIIDLCDYTTLTYEFLMSHCYFTKNANRRLPIFFDFAVFI